jgi:hypothetical protein
MGSIRDGFDTTFRDFEVPNIPASGRHEVDKADARSIGTVIETYISTNQIIVTFVGDYDATVTYSKYQGVQKWGSSYASRINGNLNNTPVDGASSAQWQLVAAGADPLLMKAVRERLFAAF